MEEKVLYSYSGLFDTPDDIIHAAEKTKEEGYEKFDIHTPYPVHGMDGAMGLKRSKLGYVALVLGLGGLVTALAIIYWMVVIDYPLIIGGKPYFAFPAFVPILFEVTVLGASVGTVLFMLFVFFKFPNNSHPLHDTPYMKAVSSDKYGLTILAEDAKFDEAKVQAFFESLGATLVTPIYFQTNEIQEKPKLFEPKFITFLVFAFIAVSWAVYFSYNSVLFWVPFNWMSDQNKTVAQEESEFFTDEYGMRKPVQGTVARGYLPYAFAGQPEAAAENLVNPLLPTEANLNLGQEKYNIYCSPCHGYFGEGDSRLQGQFPNPPSLHSAKVSEEWSDGRIYHVIVEGQNVMPSYSSQMSREERWATVLYVRALQRSLNAKESDLQ